MQFAEQYWQKFTSTSSVLSLAVCHWQPECSYRTNYVVVTDKISIQNTAGLQSPGVGDTNNVVPYAGSMAYYQ